MKYLASLILLLGLVSCSDPVKELRIQAINSFPEFWEQPDQLAKLRKVHNIPDAYPFKSLDLIGSATNKEQDYGLYEWAFRFGKDFTNMIEIRMICYYDTDSVVMHDVKTENIQWKDLKIISRSFSFRGIEDEL